MHFVAYIDGSCIRNGSDTAQGGFGVVLLVNGEIIATCSMPLCHCDRKRHTSNLAELRAAFFVITFIHEYVAWGKPKHDCTVNVVGADGRPLDSRDISLTVYSDSRFVVDGYNEKNKHKAHRNEWNNVCIPFLSPSPTSLR